MTGIAKSHYICFDFPKNVSYGLDVYCTLSRTLCWAGFSFALCSFGCSFVCRLLSFREFTTAMATSTMAVYVCVIILCSFFLLFITN